MPKMKTKEEALSECLKDGKILDIESIDMEKIKAATGISRTDIEVAEDIKKNLEKSSKRWSTVYKLYYDALHGLAESLLEFDKVKILNHQCLFVYLCKKHPELEFNWDFFEKVRTKRNGINYYGTPVTFEDWKEIEFQMKLYISTLIKEIGKKLKSPHNIY